MSSIYGAWLWSNRLELPSLHRAMAQAMAAYGPDKAFLHTDAAPSELALGGNLSAFLPEDTYDRQPITLEHAQGWLVADIRIDNRADLLRELSLSPHAPLADSSVLALAWQRWQAGCLGHITGVFAFAVWNPARQELFLCRDHTGERPLFYHRGKDFFAFASMPRGLLAIPGADQGLDEDTLLNALCLARYSPAASFFKGIDRVPPGHQLRVTRGQVELSAYWRPFEAPAPAFKRDKEYAEAFLEIFDAATAARLRSTGGIGSQLSAGLDSSSVTASAAIQLAGRGERLTAFTAVPRPVFFGKGFPGRMPDEGPGARDVARLYPNIDHVLLDSAGIDLVSTVSRMSDAACEPIHNSINGLWLAAILEACRERSINTLLIGMRGNLTLSHSGIEALGLMLRRGQWFTLARPMLSFRRNGFVSLRNAAAAASTGLLPDRVFRWLHRTQDFDLSYSPVNQNLAETQRLRDKMLEEFFKNRFSTREDRLHLFQIYDFDTYAAAYQAVHGIDVRDPCADRRVVDFCFSLPSEQYVAAAGALGPVPRSLVRRAMQHRLPGSTLSRTVRGQQGADWPLSLRDALPSLRPQLALNEQSPTAARLLDLPRMRTLLETWPEDLAQLADPDSMQASFAWGDALCRAFSFGYFIRRHEKPRR